jgi:hypothetical protein
MVRNLQKWQNTCTIKGTKFNEILNLAANKNNIAKNLTFDHVMNQIAAFQLIPSLINSSGHLV